MTEEIAFVTDISGVCSAGVTAQTTIIADEDGQHENRKTKDEGIDRAAVAACAVTAAACASWSA